MEHTKRQCIRPSKTETQNKSIPIQPSLEEDDLCTNSNEPILEKFQAPLFFFNGYRGQRLAFQLKSGEVNIGTVGQQQWQFLRLENVVVSKDGNKKALKWKMVNINRIESFNAPDVANDKAV